MLDDYPKVQAGPPKPSSIIIPNVFSMPPGTERYVVEGQGAVLIPIETGDQITIINAEGGQRCEIVVADPKGKIDAGIIGASTHGDAAGLKALLASDNQSLRGMRMGLDARGIDIAKAQAVRLFEPTTPAKTEALFTANRAGTVIIAAPGGVMDFEAQNTATPLTIMIKRAVIKSSPRFELPDPLADPISDIRVHTQTAEAFFVKAGDYIQIIDVDGRQCTDFECFSARKLDQGIEHALDVTTTRTLMGHAYPMPGLHANTTIKKWCRCAKLCRIHAGVTIPLRWPAPRNTTMTLAIRGT